MIYVRASTLSITLLAAAVSLTAASPSAFADPGRYWCPLGHVNSNQTSQCLEMPGNGYPQVSARSDGKPVESCEIGNIHTTVSTAKRGRGYRYWSCDYSMNGDGQAASFGWREWYLP